MLFFKRNSKKTPKNESSDASVLTDEKNESSDASVPTNEYCCSDKLKKAYEKHWIHTNTICVNDPDPEYYYSNDSFTAVSWENVYEIKKVVPSPDWEIAKVGIHAKTGKFYRIESRQKSYGVFLGGEDAYNEISQSEFCAITGRNDVTSDNSLSFVPDELKKFPDAPKITEKECEFNGINGIKRHKYNIAFLSVEIKRRFGTDTVELRKYKDGYRAFHSYSSSNFPGNTSSRHLSETEVSYIIDALPMEKPHCVEKNRYGSANISMYGGEHIDAFCILEDGDYFYFGSEKYALTVYDRLESVVAHKLIFKKSFLSLQD